MNGEIANEQPDSGAEISRREFGRQALHALGALFVAETTLLTAGSASRPNRSRGPEVPPIPEFPELKPDQNVLVVPMLIEDGDLVPDHEQLEQAAAETHAFYDRSSHGKANVQFKLLPVQHVCTKPLAHLGIAEVLESIAAAGDEVVAESGIEADRFQTRLYTIGIPIGQFGEPGRGQRREPQTYNRIWVNGLGTATGSPQTLSTFWEHELGHAFGLNHDQQWLHAETATPGDYSRGLVDANDHGGDSLMGSGGDLNVCQKLALGWVDRSQITTITEGKTYSLHSQEGASANDRLALRIPFQWRNPASGKLEWRFYYVEYKPVRYYSDITPPAAEYGGLEIRLWDEKIGSPTEQVFIDSPNPAATSLGDSDQAASYVAVMRDGSTFYDRASGVRIRQRKHGTNTALVEITLDRR